MKYKYTRHIFPAVLLLAVAAGAFFLAGNGLADDNRRQALVWTLAQADMAYGQDVAARLFVPRLNRYVLVVDREESRSRQDARYATWQKARAGGSDISLITADSREAFSFLRYIGEDDVIVLQMRGGQEKRYQVRAFAMTEDGHVNMPDFQAESAGRETLLLGTVYDVDDNDASADRLHFVVMAQETDETV